MITLDNLDMEKDLNQSLQAQALVRQAKSLGTQANTLRIRNQVSAEIAARWLAELKQLKLKAEEFFNPIVEAANATLKAARAAKAKVLGPIEQEDNILRAKLNAYITEEEAKRRSAIIEQQQKEEDYQRRLEAAKKPALVKSPKAVAIPEPQKLESIPKRTVARYQIEFPDLIPYEFWIVNESAIKSALRDGVREIPGVKIWEEQIVSVY